MTRVKGRDSAPHRPYLLRESCTSEFRPQWPPRYENGGPTPSEVTKAVCSSYNKGLSCRNQKPPPAHWSIKSKVQSVHMQHQPQGGITVPLLRGTERAGASSGSHSGGITQRQPHPPALSPDPENGLCPWWTEGLFPAPPPRLGRPKAGRWAGAGAAAVAAALGEASGKPAPCLPPWRNLLDVLTHSTTWSHRTPRRSGGGALLSQNSLGVFGRGAWHPPALPGVSPLVSEKAPRPSPHLTAGKTEATAGLWGFPSDPGRLGQACPEPWGTRGVTALHSGLCPHLLCSPEGIFPRQRNGETMVASEAKKSAQSHMIPSAQLV